MPEPHFATTMDDDLPRTLRRERDARERQAREREAAERAQMDEPAPSFLTSPTLEERRAPEPARMMPAPADGSTVRRLDIPFMHLVGFFMKATLAAIPALVMLMIILWGIGEIAQRAFPWLIQMRILIHFPG